MATELGIGEPTLNDIFEALARPERDPREDLPKPIFKKGILRLEDLAAGMELKGTVLNVVDFGAFVDIGLKDSGLVHISQLANRYIKSPHDVVSVGDVVSVWVMGVDGERKRVSLTMVQPGTERPRAERERPPAAAVPVEAAAKADPRVKARAKAAATVAPVAVDLVPADLPEKALRPRPAKVRDRAVVLPDLPAKEGRAVPRRLPTVSPASSRPAPSKAGAVAAAPEAVAAAPAVLAEDPEAAIARPRARRPTPRRPPSRSRSPRRLPRCRRMR